MNCSNAARSVSWSCACSGVKLPSASRIPQRYSSEPLASQNGLPSKSKKRSPGEGSGRSAKPSSGCGSRRTYLSSPCSRAKSWSAACSRILSKVSCGNPGGGSVGRAPERSERRDAGDGELVDLRAADARRRERGGRPYPSARRRAGGSRRSRSARRAKARCAAGRRRTPRAGGERGGSKRRTPPAERTRARQTRARRA